MCTNQLHYRKRPRKAETGIKDGFEEMEYEIRLSVSPGNFLPKRPEKSRPIYFLFRLFISQKLFVNDKQPPRTILKLHPSTLFLASPTTRVVKTSILKWIRVFSNFVAFIPIG